MLRGIIGGLVVLWLVGMVFHLAGGAIHLLLLVAVLLLVANLLAASRTVV